MKSEALTRDRTEVAAAGTRPADRSLHEPVDRLEEPLAEDRDDAASADIVILEGAR